MNYETATYKVYVNKAAAVTVNGLKEASKAILAGLYDNRIIDLPTNALLQEMIVEKDGMLTKNFNGCMVRVRVQAEETPAAVNLETAAYDVVVASDAATVNSLDEAIEAVTKVVGLLPAVAYTLRLSLLRNQGNIIKYFGDLRVRISIKQPVNVPVHVTPADMKFATKELFPYALPFDYAALLECSDKYAVAAQQRIKECSGEYPVLHRITGALYLLFMSEAAAFRFAFKFAHTPGVRAFYSENLGRWVVTFQ